MKTRQRPLEEHCPNTKTNKNRHEKRQTSKKQNMGVNMDKENVLDIQNCNSVKKKNKVIEKVRRKLEEPILDQYFQNSIQFCQNYQILTNQQSTLLYQAQDSKFIQITDNNRKKLIEWILEIHKLLKLRQDTLYMTIYLIDQYVKKKGIDKKYYQLLGLSSLFIAGKYQEIATLKMKSLVKFFQDYFLAQDILAMQSQILKSLQFKISRPNLNWFLNAYLLEIQLISKKKMPAKFMIYCEYTMELCILQKQLNDQYEDKHIAKAILYVCSMQGQFLSINPKQLLQKTPSNQKKQLRTCFDQVKKIYQKRDNEKYNIVNERYPICSSFGIKNL